ncbi:uncharacterized protein [Montipora capricornis]|uniref:uncharacterized protein isoform X1 n=1 Tax=Montipora capricornis TaxID=246305 RepID=UPI0035F16FBD
MEPREKRILDEKLKLFMKDVIPVELLPYLSCLTRFDKEEIEASQNNHGPTRACYVLVDRLKKRSQGFKQFVQALRQSGFQHVALLLDPWHHCSPEGNEAAANFQVDEEPVLFSEMSELEVIQRGNNQARIPTTVAVITGPDQLVSKIPFRISSKLALLLARDRVGIVSKLFNFTVEDALAFRDITDHTNNLRESVDPMFQLMSHRRVTVDQLVQVLKEMQRLDAIRVLIEAGYPADNALEDGSDQEAVASDGE